MFGSSVKETAVKLELFVCQPCFPRLNSFTKEQRVGNKQEMPISMLRVYIVFHIRKREILPPIFGIIIMYLVHITS